MFGICGSVKLYLGKQQRIFRPWCTEICYRDRTPGAENSPGEWQEFSLCADVPKNETALNLAVFFWKIKAGEFEVTSLRLLAQ